MWLLSTEKLELVHFNNLKEVLENSCPRARKEGYAILSHVWARDRPTTEQSFEDIQNLVLKGEISYADEKNGIHAKVRGCARAAKELGFAWVWDDTCCIDKRSSAELEEAINSMYRWYAEATICLAYLQDVPDGCVIDEKHSAFRKSEWFKRGWTLQELLAPHCLVFLSVNWKQLGTKAGLSDLLQEITAIDAEVLTFRRPLQHVSVARRMSWASKRKTSRVEDEAYSLLGIFNVSMATIYGEGSYAFRRLQVKIMKRTADHTLFAWGDTWPPINRGPSIQTLSVPPNEHNPSSSPPKPTSLRHAFTPPLFEQSKSLFAPSPAHFKYALMTVTSVSEVVKQARHFFYVDDIPDDAGVYEHRVTSLGVRCNFIVIPGRPFWLALLLCKNTSDQCVALPLWPPQDGSDFRQLFRAGFRSSDSSYKLIPISSSGLQALRDHGWVADLEENSKGGPSSFPSPGRGEHHWQNTSKALDGIALIKTVNINDVHPSSLPVGTYHALQLRQEPHLLYFPPWLAACLALHGLELDSDPPIRLDEAVKPPSALRIIQKHQSAPDTVAFVILFSLCGGKLSATVEFPVGRSCAEAAQGNQRQPDPGWFSPGYAYFRDSGSQPPWMCRQTRKLGSHVHINSWKHRSIYFASEGKEVRLCATPWPTAESYCLEIGLEGEYFSSLRKLQAVRARAQPQTQPPPGTSPQTLPAPPMSPDPPVRVSNSHWQATDWNGHSQPETSVLPAPPNPPNPPVPVSNSHWQATAWNGQPQLDTSLLQRLTKYNPPRPPRPPRRPRYAVVAAPQGVPMSGATSKAPPARNVERRGGVVSVSAPDPVKLPPLDSDSGYEHETSPATYGGGGEESHIADVLSR